MIWVAYQAAGVYVLVRKEGLLNHSRDRSTGQGVAVLGEGK